MPDQDAMLQLRTEYLNVVQAVRPEAFRGINAFEEIPAAVYMESRLWGDQIFRQDRGPHQKTATVRHAYYLAKGEAGFDLLRHEYVQDGIAVTVTESRVFMHIALRGFTGAVAGISDPLAQATALSALLFNVPSKVQFQWLSSDPKYRSFSNNPGLFMLNMRAWMDRIDGVVSTDEIIFLCYKIRRGADPLVNPSAWFPEKFRRASGQ